MGATHCNSSAFAKDSRGQESDTSVCLALFAFSVCVFFRNKKGYGAEWSHLTMWTEGCFGGLSPQFADVLVPFVRHSAMNCYCRWGHCCNRQSSDRRMMQLLSHLLSTGIQCLLQLVWSCTWDHGEGTSCGLHCQCALQEERKKANK